MPGFWRAFATRRQAESAASKGREKTQVCLYASNIAACIGMNPYKKPHKALEEMWIRQFPQSYQAAASRMERETGLEVQTESEVVAAAASKNRVGKIMQEALDKSAAVTSSADAVAVDSSAKMAISSRVSKRATREAHKVLKRAEKELSEPVKAQVEKVLSADLPLERKMTAIQQAFQSGGPLTAAAEVAGNAISETLQAAQSEAVLIQKHVQREIYTGHGIRSEAPMIQVYASRFERQVREDTRFLVKPLPLLACKRQILIGGRVDGIASCDGEDILVEVKTRMKRLFPQTPLYEQVQTQTLLEILGLQRGELVQCLRGASRGEIEMNVLPFSKDNVLWNEELKPMISNFSLLFDSFLDNGDMMQSLLACKSDDAAKEKLVADWLASSRP
jgi:hypothetical protein